MSDVSADVDLLLPWDIFLEILLRLPSAPLFRSRTVCKRWLTVIDDPSFRRAHANRRLSSFSHTNATVVIKGTLSSKTARDPHLFTCDLDALSQEIISGSSLDLSPKESQLLKRFPVSACNGLILVVAKDKTIEIWNLSTQERLQLPPRLPPRQSLVGPLFTGLGYDHAAQDFKAVAMDSLQAHVYSLRSDKWTKFKVSDESLFESLDPQYQGVFVCGAVHWLLDDNKIVALDLGNDHRLRDIPLFASQEGVHFRFLDVLGGCLAVSGFSKVSDVFYVWVMNYNGSWTKLLSMTLTNCLNDIFRPFAYAKDKNQVFLNYSGLEETALFRFDVESGCMKRVEMHGRLTKCYLDAQIIPQTKFRLSDHCGGGGSGTSRILPLGSLSMNMVKVSSTTEEIH